MKTNSKLNNIVQLPSDNPEIIKERLYGIAAIGEVPNRPFVTNPTPKELNNNPPKKMI